MEIKFYLRKNLHNKIEVLLRMGIGDWGLGIGDWPNPQSPIPNPQSPIHIIYFT